MLLARRGLQALTVLMVRLVPRGLRVRRGLLVRLGRPVPLVLMV